MNWLKQLYSRRRRYNDLSVSIQEHLEEKFEELMEDGMSREEATRTARREFGNVTLVEERSREVWQWPRLESIWADIRYAARQLRKSPGFAITVGLTLAIGIGANTAIFSMLEGVVLAPLPYYQAKRLVIMWESNPHALNMTPSGPDFRDWQRTARSFQQIAAFRGQAPNLTNPGTPEHLDGKEISSGVFSTLGVKLTLGRNFSRQEDQRGGGPVVIISERLWRDRFGASAEALGKPITLDGVDYAVVGVVPSGFRFPGDEDVVDVYTPLGQVDPLILNDRSIHTGIVCIARLKPGVSAAQAREEMSAVQNHLDQIYPKADRGLGTNVAPLKEEIVGNVGGTLLMLLGAVGLVLLIACANIANLMLARSAARTGEFAIRLALGANRARLARQLLTESVLLSLAGGVLGLAVAKWGVPPVLAALPGNLPRGENIGVNFPVFLFTFGLAVVVGILFGILPALKGSHTDLQSGIKQGGRGFARGHNRAQSILVVIQMALTLVLLVGAGLLLRTVRRLLETNPGFDTQHIVTFRVGLSPSVTNTPSTVRIAYRQLIERIGHIPGVQAADLTTLVPLSQKNNSVPFWVGPQAPTSLSEAPQALMYETGPDYLRTMGIPLLQGRFFSAEDNTTSAPVVVIDSLLAKTYFPGRDAVGQTITFAHVGAYRVIGVVGHVKHWGLGNTGQYTQYQTYTPFYQMPDRWLPVMHTLTTVLVRTPLETAAVMPAIRKVVYGAGDDQPVYAVQTMGKIVSDSMKSQRFPMLLLGAFAVFALLLASLGIYGVISYLMTQRMREIGIRMALGAEKRDVFRMVIAEGLRLALGGLAIGAIIALILTRLLSSFSHLLYGVGADDPVTFITVSAVLTSAALLACYIPARHAASIDPVHALRME